MLKELLKSLVTLLIKMSPKSQFCYMKAMPSFDDSAVAVYTNLPMERLDKVIWSVYNEQDIPPFEDRGKTIFVKKGTLRDFFYGIVSKYIFTTHGHFVPDVPRNQICVNLWHGMPLKAIGLLDGQPGRKDTLVCSTSPVYQDILSRAFGVGKERVLISGLPRNDFFKSADPAAIWQKAGIDREKFDKVFLWLPTYRKSVLGHITEEGVECDNVFNMVEFPEAEFDAFLKEQNCLCILKPHPMAPRKEATSSDNILIIDEDWLWQRQLMLYPLLGQMDFLVSDISSVMIDYLLLDRPMIVCFEDAEQYKKSRNTIFNPIEDYLPGEIVGSYQDLTESIRGCVNGQDIAKAKRVSLKEKFHRHNDFESTNRVLNAVFGK